MFDSTLDLPVNLNLKQTFLGFEMAELISAWYSISACINTKVHHPVVLINMFKATSVHYLDFHAVVPPLECRV